MTFNPETFRELDGRLTAALCLDPQNASDGEWSELLVIGITLIREI